MSERAEKSKALRLIIISAIEAIVEAKIEPGAASAAFRESNRRALYGPSGESIRNFDHRVAQATTKLQEAEVRLDDALQEFEAHCVEGATT